METQGPVVHKITDDLLELDSKAYGEYESGPTVEQLIESGRQFDKVQKAFVIPYHPHEAKRAPFSDSNPHYALDERSNNCDAVVLATVKLRRSGLTSLHHFVFSDYETKLDQVYLDKKKLLRSGENIVISRAGGEMTVDKSTVRAIETEFPLFHVDRQYLLFLHYLPSGSYLATPDGSYLLDGAVLHTVKTHANPDSSSILFSDAMNSISTAANRRRN